VHLADFWTYHGTPPDIPQPKGMLICTRDGRMSVQLMYPKSANALSDEYVQDGYEASFGSYDVDEGTHTLTPDVQGSAHARPPGRQGPSSRFSIHRSRAPDHQIDSAR
jgi:hypothetical protein